MKREIMRIVKVSLLTLTLFQAIFGIGQAPVLTQHNDNARTGQNLNETVLNTSNVNQNSFGKLFWRTVDGFIYAQPLYVPGLTIEGATHNVVYVATQHNSVYAFDADDPNTPAPLWQVNLGTPVPSEDICIITGDNNPSDCPYYDISPEIGITSTPVIDPVAGIIYVVSRTKNTSNGTYHDYLHALDLTTGIEQLGGPVEIAGQVSGTGTGSQGGILTFDPAYHHQRPSLLLANGVLYLGFGSVGDIGTWHGWVMTYNATTLQQEGIFCVDPDGNEGGVWSAGQGPVADAANNAYIMTGNGDFNANLSGGRNYGDSFVKFSGPTLTVGDYFTPYNQGSLNVNNTDLGSGGPMLMPGTSLLVGMGKDGIFRVVNTNSMGEYNSSVDNDVQEFTATPNPFYSSPVYWNSPNYGPVLYIWGAADYLKAFQFTGSQFQTTPVSQGTILNSSGESNAAAISVSANGSQQGSGIVWTSAAASQWASGVQVPGVIRAFDGTNLTSQLWNSTQNLARDDIGNSAKFNPPTITNGKVYVGSFSGQLQVYGLNPPAASGVRFVQVAAATPQSSTATVSVTYPGAQAAGDLNVVVVGWNDSTSTVRSITDSLGNTYVLASGPIRGTALSESVYYAKNIVGGSSNAVTVTFNQAAAKPDVRILEYSGADQSNPLDVSAGASGNSNIADSGFVMTNAANELIVGASMVSSNTTIMMGAPFTPRIITTPDSDVAADRLVNVPGSYHSWAPLVASGSWLMQVVTFRSATVSTVPFVTSVSPNNGPVTGGTAVTITGMDFAAGAAVTFGGTAAANVVVVNSTTITATTPADSAGAVTVTVTNPGGQSGNLTNGFTYLAPPTVTNVNPNSGSTLGGTAVTITGTSFLSGATVTFGGAAATNVVVVNSTTITATTPTGSAGAVTVTVTNPGGQSGSLTNGYTYVVEPTVSSVSPNSGPTAGGTAVTITGTNFAAGATVTFGTNAATNVVVVSSTTITATTPAGSAGPVTVTVTVNGQGAGLSSGFIYIGQPTVSSVSPNNGPVAGGTAVTITGTNFAAGATVTFGGSAATNVVVVNSTTITATTPAGSAGAVTVTVTNLGGQSGSLANGFTYYVPAAISFSQVAAATPQSPTATVPVNYPAAQTLGDLNVVVVGWNDTTATVQSVSDSAGNHYSLAIGPTSGTGLQQSIYYAPNIVGGNNTVTVTFSQAAAYPDVRILEYRGVTTLDVTAGTNGSSASANSGSATTTSPNELIFGANIVATGTAAAGSGFTSRIITSPDGDIAEDKVVTTVGSYNATATLTSSGPWVMQMATFSTVSGPAPTVSSVSPNSGPTAGGTAVTITGTNFASGATVTFGGTAATNVVVANSTTITATTPAGTAGAVTVTVTNSGGQSGSLTNGFTYIASPTISSISPSFGPVAGGTAVTITGTNFASGATVTFGGAAATNVVVVSSTSITATTPAGSPGVVTVMVTNPGGQSGSLVNGFTYIAQPTVSSVSPNSGPTAGGTAVTITGTNFATGATVTFGGTAATNVVVVNSTTITATTPAGGAGAVTVTVTNLGGQSGSLANGFTYVVAPTLSSVSPNYGPVAGGTAVTITGTNFAAGATVTFGGTAATNVVVVNSTTITATTPAHAAGAVTVMVTVNGQSGSLTNGFTYIAQPTVSSVSPNSGPTAGGTAVTITGTNFAAGATVTFGGTAATNVVVVSSTSITATTPAGSPGAVTMTVTNLGGQSGSLTNGFTYVVAPTVSSVSPNSGPPAGGTAVTITGTNFAAGATVTFGGTAATNVVVVNSTTITATTPAHAAGAVTVMVTVNGQSGSLTNGFTYIAPPTVSSVSPNSGTTAGGTAVTITGTNFAAGATVTFGGTAATNVVVVSSTSITATTPAHAAGAVTVMVTVSGQSGSLTNGYTYVVVPTVSSVSPNSGPTAGGTAVTITGTNFAAGATVKFGTTAATNVVVVNSTTITATIPAHAAGTVTVTVTVNGQSGSLTNGFTYIAPPTVSSVSPNNGPTAGGTAVTITGTNFAGGATVTFGGTAATNVVVVSSTSITATTPAHAAGAVTVTVTVYGKSGSQTNGFTYIAPPTVSGVSPNSGTTAGGTAVTITGTNFAAGATVTFGGTAATNVVVVSSTSITATTPAHAAGAVTVMVTVSGQSGSLTNGYTYVVVPTVSSVSPNSGPTAGGTAVTITGTNFAAGATVTFGGTAATNVVVLNSTTITATTPAHAAGAVTVTVTVNGQSGNLTNGFTYIGQPTVSSVSPNSGPVAGGTAVTITGTSFAAGATVTFGGTAATNVVVVNSTTITATTPAHTAGAVTVMVTVNGQSGSLTNGYTYVLVPTVSSVSPNIGPASGGTAVTITGTNFAAGATVTFGGAAATNVVVVNSTTITATTPAGNAGPVTVTVTVSGQSGSLTNGFTYTGTAVISFSQVAAATPQSPTATVPVNYPAAQTAGDLNVVVVGWNDTTATVQSVSDSAGNHYSLAIGPTSGAGLQQSIYYAPNILGGSNTVTVTFSQAAAYPDVRILEYRGVTTLDVTAGANGSSASANSGSATTTSPNELIFGANMVATGTAAAGSGFTSRIITSPDGDIAEDKVVTAAGSYNATATLTSSGPWVMQMVTFSGPVPTVSSVSPNSGPTAGGTAVTITGTNFASGATVTFGGTAATNVVVVNSTTITATTPAGTAGPVTVTVTNPGGQSGSLANGFTYIASPTISSVSPNFGPVAGGTAVTITGTNFASGATVTFGGTAATNVVVVSTTSITATTPAGSPGAVTVTVTNPGGQSGNLLNGFTYIAQPTVSSVSPNNGTTLGGTAVTITGTNFATGATVTFGGTTATNVVVVNSTTITATTPVGNAGPVMVTVTNLGGQSGSLTNGFTYIVTSGLTAPGNFSGTLMGTLAPTYVAGQEYYNAASGVSFTSSPFNSTGADLLVMFLGCHNNTVFTITDSYGNTWLPLAGPAFKVGSANFPMEGELFYAPNATTGAGHTITVGLSQSEPLVMSIAALSGDNNYSPIDTYSFITGDNGTIAEYIASSPLTTLQPNDLLLGIVKGFFNNTYTAGTGYTAQPASTGLNFSAETATASTPGNYASSFTASVGDFWQTVLAAIAPKPNETALSWSASTGGIVANYYIERCTGLGCSNFSQIGSTSSSTLTYTDTTISSGTIYNYRVRAESSSGPYSPYSNVQALSPIVPYVVSSLVATPVRTLTWNASAESGGSISQYSIERCTGVGCSNFSQAATTSSTSYTDNSAAAGTTYNYRVRAQDANNFYGPYSVAATASIPAYFDNVADGGNNGGSTTSLTYSYTVGTNSNRLLLVNLVGDSSADDISFVTYAGVSMTLITKVQTPAGRWHYLYYLLGPASGTNNVVITAATSHYLISEAASWYNVTQAGQPGAYATNTAASGVSLTTSLPASSNNAIVVESMWAPVQIFPGSGSSELVLDSAFQGLGIFSSVPAPVTQAFPVSMTNTWGGQDTASSVMASFSLASDGTAGITYDNSIDGGNNGGSTASLTYSYTVGSGSNRLLVVNLIGDTSADDISSVTYAGTAMTLIGKVRAPSNNWQYLYYLLNPSSGSHSVVVTAGSQHYLISEAASWYNVKQTAQPDASTTNTSAATSTSITTSLTTVATGSLVVQGLWSYGHLAAGAGATPIITDTAFDGAGIFVSSGSPVSPPGNVSMTTVSDGTSSPGVIMASFAPAP